MKREYANIFPHDPNLCLVVQIGCEEFGYDRVKSGILASLWNSREKIKVSGLPSAYIEQEINNINKSINEYKEGRKEVGLYAGA